VKREVDMRHGKAAVDVVTAFNAVQNSQDLIFNGIEEILDS